MKTAVIKVLMKIKILNLKILHTWGIEVGLDIIETGGVGNL